MNIEIDVEQFSSDVKVSVEKMTQENGYALDKRL